MVWMTALSVGVQAGDGAPQRPLRIERAVFLVEHDGGLGSGFLTQSTGSVYFVSNIHVMSGDGDYSIKNVYGETIQVPEGLVEVASDRDLVRFPVEYPRGLTVSEDFGFGDKVCAVGNSGGGGVITRLDGEILALGPGLVEVSCKFIPGNSGGPVLSEENQVVGVSTYLQNHRYMPDWIIEGSRFEKTRRMSVRVDNVEWIPMAWEDLNREAAFVHEIEEYSNTAIELVESISTNAYEMIYSEVDHAGLQKWIQGYNQNVRKSGGRLKKITTGNSIRYVVSSSIERNHKKNLDNLVDLLRSFEHASSRTDKVSLPFFKERLERYQHHFESSRNQMETIVETMF